MESAEGIDEPPISTRGGEGGAEGAAVVPEGVAQWARNLNEALKRKTVHEQRGGKRGRTKGNVVSSQVSS